MEKPLFGNVKWLAEASVVDINWTCSTNSCHTRTFYAQKSLNNDYKDFTVAIKKEYYTDSLTYVWNFLENRWKKLRSQI